MNVINVKIPFRKLLIPIYIYTTSCNSSLPQFQTLVRTSGSCGFIFYFTLGHVGGGYRFGGIS